MMQSTTSDVYLHFALILMQMRDIAHWCCNCAT